MSKLLLVLLASPGVALWAAAAAAAAEASTESLWTALFLPLLVIFVLVLANGLFVAAEFAMIGVRPSRLQQLAEAGNATAGQVLDIREHQGKQDRYIATAQVGITIVTIVLGMYGEPAIAHFLEPLIVGVIPSIPEELVHTVSLVVVLSLLTYLHVVVGEMVPKSMALGNAERVVLAINRPMKAIQAAVLPLVRVLNGVGRLVLWLFRVPSAEGHSRAHTAEELEQIVVESTEGGLLKEEEEEMIRNIFDFSDRIAGQVMTPRPQVQAIPIDMPYPALIALVADSRHSRFPVYQDDRDHIVGILHIKDLVQMALDTPGEVNLRALLRPAPAVPEDQSLTKLLAAFKRLRIHIAIVLDEFGGMAGIVTLEDLVEEIVGEVRDEFDTEQEPLVEVAPNVLELAGTYLVADLLERIFLDEASNLPDVETVGGLVVAGLGRPPAQGDSCLYGSHVKFEVLSTAGFAVTRVRLTLLDSGEEEE